MTFDVVSANLGAGHRRQPFYRQDVHERSWAALLGSADVLLVQEARWPPNRPRKGLYAYPFRFSASLVVTDFPGTLIPAEEAVPSLPPEWRPIVAAVNVEIPGRDSLVVASVHPRAAVFPNAVPESVRRPGETDAWWNDVIFADLVRLVDGRPFIVGGDWNTCPAYDGVQSRHTGGPAFFERAGAAGWVEANPGGAATWWDSRGIGFQLDHVFVGGGAVAETARVDRAPVDEGLSDHARVRLSISL